MRGSLAAFGVTVAICLPGLGLVQSWRVPRVTAGEETPALRDAANTRGEKEFSGTPTRLPNVDAHREEAVSPVTGDFDNLVSEDDIMALVDLLERTRQELLTKLSEMEARKNAVAVADNLLARILARKEFVRIKGILGRGTQHAKSIGSKLKRQVTGIPKSKKYLWIKQQLRRSSSSLKEFLLSVKASAEEELLRLKNKVEESANNER
ncbi:hypothetical protein TGPRC2_273340 [Toxoplasma gondii TgCatPRC2]|uniref:Transmembrane protein n=12 Tax=Toxoplasma gondii TaxID=5811 RepID=B9PFW3_TOXGV|nr:hypothetical protein TGME49_273340 [Toxoplasma gondii ME49]EPR64518.1 hypothetical protein TGGT1_273340 [Toxoplasma gondii GT1]ESS35988.1 hypothetical protein TGVEG_273340 [Toxoplasma gondii VEG]KAF4642056.1 hypothetical protein TGRH88_078690 [Toxoplasma gondii]KFG28746.1 hypothetical protein TGDOM2_273340 [Toxoplasma gondii GAB2-2007-GAL-DOM2]KFG50124.1 hypothetical protein TGFOU_273340 [Toxoplasma gondii FOU]KYF46468.1 hypothetical protein TGARI_273340 [Toxoplasma gondii ARI]KYK71329.1 |eukprot:XP_002365936.1 hypothetical protein TGME49_273340 [Toxoplasma gondii ME49]